MALQHDQVKQGLGGRVRLILSGAAPLSAHLEGYLLWRLAVMSYEDMRIFMWVTGVRFFFVILVMPNHVQYLLVYLVQHSQPKLRSLHVD
ncbi:uncharacterized protein LOC106757847 [Vigna radiata var. radiata]|uniref:Uncharacterized protein LOC106757847 n=1 Tax=Vigna radiata var. radiata TaxID=3916 RepID=A0A3Q0EX99_VIGRR|nr:uncharacterized protein LOC106757847 [Vigna radiata var. radiata]XP_022635065.1 uncharacterized protein LOC106757847 [Vigna radiata var. radiata]